MAVVRAYAAPGTNSPLEPFSLERRSPGPKDVQIDILFCGVCHSDLHSVNGDWGPVNQPLVPGHEMVGRVEAVGRDVKKFKVGDLAGVGCLVDSCRKCSSCGEGLEQYCEKGPIWSYGSPDSHSGGITQGGYSTSIVTDEDFVLHIPTTIPLEQAAPLLCAGITTYSPLKHWQVKRGTRVAIAGLGGLGHMAVKIAAAMGADVTILSTSANKEKDAMALGAHHFSLLQSGVKPKAGPFDLIIDTISAAHDYNLYLNLLQRDGAMVLVGLPGPLPVAAPSLVHQRRSLAGSLIGGIAETQEMLNFCGEHRIGADVEVIAMDQINTAYKRLVKNDVHYRFVIDMKSLK